MMSLDNKIASKQDESQSSGGSGGGGGGGGGGRKTSSLRPPEQTLKCPRCDSSNTKFCYYNNYSLTQPRHFCKTCRRYWTKGGALRNVPIGGGCRKNKKTKSCSPRFITADSSSKDSSSDIGGLKFFSGLSTPPMDFQLGGLNFPTHRLTPANQFSTYGETSTTPFINFDPLGFNFPMSTHMVMKQGDHHHHQQQQQQNGGGLASFQEMGISSNSLHHNNSTLASSIESLSSINQDLHWKLQQQRLAMLFGGAGGESDQQKEVQLETQAQKLQPILFENLEISKPTQSAIGGDSRKEGGSSGGGGGGLATEWFFDNTYAQVDVSQPTPTTSNNTGNNENWSGIQAWNQLNQYSSLP